MSQGAFVSPIASFGVAVFVAMCSSPAAAGPAEGLRPAASPQSHITVESSTVLPKWTPSAVLLNTYEQDLNEPTTSQVNLDRRTTSHLLVAFGLFDWTEIGLALPLVVHQQGSTVDSNSTARVQANAVGDLRIGLKGTIFKTPSRGFGLGLGFDITAPTGDSNALAGAGKPTYAPQILFEYKLARGIVTAVNFGYIARPDQNVGGVVFGDAITYRMAARIPIDPRRQFAAVAEMDGNIGVVRGAASPLSMRAGLRWQLRSGVIFGAYGGGAPVGALGVGDVQAMLSIAYAPPGRMRTERAFEGAKVPSALAVAHRHDRFSGIDRHREPPKPIDPNDPDGDTLVAAADKCPTVAEDLDDFEDDDGCPEFDNDRDGLRDAQDLCPSSPELINGYLDWDGCPDRRLAQGKGETFKEFEPRRVLPKITFAKDSHELDETGQAQVAELAELMRLNPWIERVELSVYVTEGLDPAATSKVALARGDTIRDALRSRGIEPWRIRVNDPKTLPDGTPERVRVAMTTTTPRQSLRPLAPESDTLERLVNNAVEQAKSEVREKMRAETAALLAAQGPAAEPEAQKKPSKKTKSKKRRRRRRQRR